MSFKLFIYYCSLGGGWAAFVTWAIVQVCGIRDWENKTAYAATLGAILGALIAATIGALDAIMNAVGSQRILRVGICLTIGLLGGLLGALLGNTLFVKFNYNVAMLVVGWILVGVLIGASVGVYDLIRAMMGLNDFAAPLKKTLNGIYGGLLGGLVGGLPFGLLMRNESIPVSNLTIGLVILGLCIGLFIPLAQVVLKQAWVKVEAGFRPGREIMLMKDETLIGKAEGCDIGLFGGQGLEKQHARIFLKNNRYYLADMNTPGGTFVNERRVNGSTPLKDGDAIRVGNCVLRFGERAKR